MKRAPYQQYASTRTAWLPDSPSHWRMSKFKYEARITLGKMLQNEPRSDNDTLLPYARAASIGQDGQLVVEGCKSMWFSPSEASALTIKAGDVLVVEGGDAGRSIFVREDQPGWGFQNSVNRMRAQYGNDPRFLYYFLTSTRATGFVVAYCDVVSIPHLTAEKLGRVPMMVPPAPEQREIADFLDREVSRIDTIVSEQQGLLEALRERRSALSARRLGDLVGGGERLKWLIEEVDERAGASADDLPLMAVSISWGVRRRSEVTSDEPRAEDLANYKVCRAGELVVNRMRAFQGALGIAPEDGIVSPDYAVLHVADGVDAMWLAAVMRSPRFVAEMAKRVKGIGSADLGSARTPRINVEDLSQIRLEVPPSTTQASDLMYLDGQTEKIDALIAEAQGIVTVSKERRSALITAAVTGQIDVRGEVA